MNREYLIQKWLDHDLNAEEFEAFKTLEDYEALMTLSKGLDNFKAPDYNEASELYHITERLKAKKKNWIQPLLRIAALVVIALGSFWFLNQNTDTIISTTASQKTNVDLPDASNVALNSASSLTYNKNTWNKNRTVSLEGEAFFKVAKGAAFDVVTSEGIITVLGTEFNVKQRDNYFEVVCYEGLVGVAYNNQTQIKLKPGESFLIVDEKVITKEIEVAMQPSWMSNESTFKSIPYKHVLAEFERQHQVSFITKDIDLNKLFTGNFTHNDFEIAIQSVTLPLHLTYSKNKSTITLMRE